METVTKRIYEGLFLIDSAEASADWNSVVEMITKLLEKRGAEIVSIKKWDDRRLAYEIQDKGRGTYVLVYFNSETSAISQLERDINLSERVMRAMIIRAEELAEGLMAQDTPLEAQDKQEKAAEEEAAAKAEAKADAKAKAELEAKATEEDSKED